jgi:diphosphomevalonate decarboxylase
MVFSAVLIVQCYSLQSDLHTITTIAASTNYTTDRMWLNGKEVEIKGRLATCLREVRKLAQDRVVDGVTVVRKDGWPQYGLRISSVNTFPTGAGLASSAAGLACFVATLAKLYGVPDALMPELTAIARQGSGSASRSMYGGFVEWRKGELADGSDSIAIQHFDENVSDFSLLNVSLS